MRTEARGVDGRRGYEKNGKGIGNKSKLTTMIRMIHITIDIGLEMRMEVRSRVKLGIREERRPEEKLDEGMSKGRSMIASRCLI